jgi:hypothetical protein
MLPKILSRRRQRNAVDDCHCASSRGFGRNVSIIDLLEKINKYLKKNIKSKKDQETNEEISSLLIEEEEREKKKERERKEKERKEKEKEKEKERKEKEKRKEKSLPAPNVNVSESELLYKENENMDEKLNKGSYEIKDIPDYNKEYASEILNDLQNSEDLINQIKTDFFKENVDRKIEISHDYRSYKRSYEVLIFNYIKEYLLYIISKSYNLSKDKYGILVLQGGACVQHFSNARRITSDLDYKFYPLPQNLTKTTIEMQYNFLKNNILPYISLIDVKKILRERKLESVFINEDSSESSTKKTIDILLLYDLSFKCTFQEKRGIIKIYLKVKLSESVTFNLSLIDISLYKKDDKSNKMIEDILLTLNPKHKYLLPETIKFKIFYSLKDIPFKKNKNIDVILLSKNYLIEQIKNYISDCEHYEELKLNKLKKQQSITGDVKKLSEFTKLYPRIKLNEEYTEQLKKELEPKYISEVDDIEIYDTIEFLGCKKARQQLEALKSGDEKKGYEKKGDKKKGDGKKISIKRKHIFKKNKSKSEMKGIIIKKENISKSRSKSKSMNRMKIKSKFRIKRKIKRKIRTKSRRKSIKKRKIVTVEFSRTGHL